MLGGRSLKLATVAGIRIGVDPSWFLVLFLIIYLLSGSYDLLYPDEPVMAFVLATISALLFFGSVVLHELGHAIVAMRNGIGISGIDLWLFGGIAKMSRDSDSAGVEFRIAAAGPLVTLLIIVVCALAGIALAGTDRFDDALLFDAGRDPVEAVLGYLGVGEHAGAAVQPAARASRSTAGASPARSRGEDRGPGPRHTVRRHAGPRVRVPDDGAWAPC